MGFRTSLGSRSYVFADLKSLMAKASPLRSGDCLSGVAAATSEERIAAALILAEMPLKRFLDEPLIPYEEDEVTRVILDDHQPDAFEPISGLTVGDLRNWLLSDAVGTEDLSHIARGLTPEMVAAVSKLMRNQDLILVSAKCRVVTRFRNTLGLSGCLSVRLQPNHPTDDVRGVGASIIDGLLNGAGDAVIGVNPASDNLRETSRILLLLDKVRQKFDIPTQTCVLGHVTTTLKAIEGGLPVDLVFQSIGGTEGVNRSFGVSVALLEEAYDAALSLGQLEILENWMHFKQKH